MDRVRFYLEQAYLCSDLVAAARDPRRRELLAREREDWLALAATPRPLAEPRSFAEPGEPMSERRRRS